MKKLDQYINWTKDHRVLSLVIFLGIVVIALGQFTDAVSKIGNVIARLSQQDEKAGKFDVEIGTEFIGREPVKILKRELRLQFVTEPNKDGLVATNKNLPYVIILDVLCRITNFSPAPITIEKIDALLNFKELLSAYGFSEIITLRSLDGADIVLPKLIQPGEQIVAIARILWPLEKTAVDFFKGTCKDEIIKGLPIDMLVACLNQHNMSLSQLFEPGIQRELRIYVRLPRDQYFESSAIDLDKYGYMLDKDK